MEPLSGALTQHQAKQRRANDAQHAAGHGADQPPQTERPHTQLKDNYRAGRPRAHARAHPFRHAKWMKKITDSGKKSHKKKTENNQIHKADPPLEEGKSSRLGIAGEYPTRLRCRQGGKAVVSGQ